MTNRVAMDSLQVSPLLRLPLFSDLSGAAQARLEKAAFFQQQPAGAILFEQGDNAQFLHVILSGRVALVGEAPTLEAELAGQEQGDHHPAAEREAIIEMFSAGEVVTAAAVLLQLPYMMSARVQAPARIAFVPGDLVREFLDTEAAFAKQMALMLARHWRLLSRQLKDQKLRSGTQRLCGYLLSLVSGAQEGPVEIDLPIDRRTLASWLGMTAENLSRSLAQLKPLGLHISGRHAQVDDIARIRAFSLEDDLR